MALPSDDTDMTPSVRKRSKRRSSVKGRRPGVDSQKATAIVAGIRLGAPLEVAAQAAGVARTTFWTWMRKGDEGKQPYAAFSESVRAREAEVHVLVVGSIRQAAMHDPAIALRWMQMRWWQYYLEHTKVDMSLDLDAAVQRVADATGMTKEAVLAEAERILDLGR